MTQFKDSHENHDNFFEAIKVLICAKQYRNYLGRRSSSWFVNWKLCKNQHTKNFLNTFW